MVCLKILYVYNNLTILWKERKMKSKLCWVPFVPVALAVIVLKILDTLNVFPLLPTNMLSYVGIGLILLMFAVCVIFTAIDKKTSPAYLLTRNYYAAVFAMISAGCIASRSALTIILALQNSTFSFMTFVVTLFGMAASVCFVVISLAHFQGRNFLPRMAAFMLVMPIWAGVSLISEFLDNRKVSVADVDSFKLFSLAFAMIFLFKLAMIIATVDGGNPVKSMYLYGFPVAALGLAAGAKAITSIAISGIDYSENVISFAFFGLGLYALSLIVEITKLSRTKEEQIIQYDLDDFDEEQRVYGAHQDNFVAAPEEQTGDYDYDYSYATEAAEEYVTSSDEDYTEDYDYYGYGDEKDVENLVVAPNAGEDDDVIYVDSSVVDDFEDNILGAKPHEVESPAHEEEKIYDDADMEKINRLIDEINS